MLPLLTLRTHDGAASTDAPKRDADGTVISTTDNDAIDFLIGLIEKGFVSLRPRAFVDGGGYQVGFHMEVFGGRRNNTAPTSEEPAPDTLRDYILQLRNGSFGLQRDRDSRLFFTTAQLSDRIRRAMAVRKEKVLKLMVNWIRGTGEFNAFGFFRDDSNRRWLFDAFHTALNDVDAGEYLAILEDQYGFVKDDAEFDTQWGHDRRWIRPDDGQERVLDGPVLAAMLARQKMFTDEIKKRAAAEEALRQEQPARQAVQDAAAFGRANQQRIEQAQMADVQANRARRQQMYDQAYSEGLDSVASEDVRWYNSTYVTEQFETYFKRTTFASYMKDINALRGSYRVPLMDTPMEFPLTSWEAAAAAHAILATIANMCDSLKAEYQRQNLNPLTDADRITVQVTLENLRLPQLKGGSVKIYVRTIPSAVKRNSRTAGALGGVSWTVYPKDDGKDVASAELYLQTSSIGPIDSLRRLHIALNKIVTPLPSSSGHVDFNVATSGWKVTSVQAKPKVSQVATVDTPKTDEFGFRSRRPRP
jgi:hypothetical protein